MKAMNVAEMHTVNAGGTSYVTKYCRYCGWKYSASYNNAWYCSFWTKPLSQFRVNSEMSMHEKYCKILSM